MKEGSSSNCQTLRVLFVLPSNGLAGGVKTTIEMANRLDRDDIAASVLFLKTVGGLRHSLRRLVNLYNPNLDSMSKYLKVPALEACDISRSVLDAFDVIVAVGTFTVEEVASWDTKAKKARWCKGLSHHRSEEMRKVWGISMPTAVVSSPLEDELRKISGEEVWGVVPNGIDLTKYYVESQIRDGIGSVFSWHSLKAPDDIMAICDRLPQVLPENPVRLFGACRRPRRLKCQEYVPFATPLEARRIYNQSLVWFVASKSEGFGNPILEAMACGAAVVVTNQGASPWLVANEETGILVEVGDVDGFVDAVTRIANDSALRERLVKNSEVTVQKYSWDASVEKMKTFIRDVKADWKPSKAARKPENIGTG